MAGSLEIHMTLPISARVGWGRVNAVRCSDRTYKSFVCYKCMTTFNILALVITLFCIYRYLITAARVRSIST